MNTNLLKPDYIFETSWEICNKVGGIHTVIDDDGGAARPSVVRDRSTLVCRGTMSMSSGGIVVPIARLSAVSGQLGSTPCMAGRAAREVYHPHMPGGSHRFSSSTGPPARFVAPFGRCDAATGRCDPSLGRCGTSQREVWYLAMEGVVPRIGSMAVPIGRCDASHER